MSLTRLAVNRPVTTIMSCLIVMILGVISLHGLAIDLLPEITYPTVTVYTIYQGAGPEEVETLITRPLEQALSSVSGVERISSSSAEGSSTIRTQLAWGTDIDAAIADMRQAIGQIQLFLPEDMEEPYFRKYDVADSAVIYLGMASTADPIGLTQLADRHIVPRLERIKGVARVRLRGAVRREIQVDLRRSELEARNLSVIQVVAALRRENTIGKTADLEEGHVNLLVRSRGEFHSLAEIADTVVRADDAAVVRVRDIGTVTDGHERRTELARTNGKPGMMIYVYKQAGANTNKVCCAVRDVVVQLNDQLETASLMIRLDKSDYIRESVANVRASAFYGIGLSILVLIVFLRSFRSTLVIAVSMPISVLATFVLVYSYGLTLNLISFGGLALGIGLLVDNSIVVLESIFRHRAEGKDAVTAAIDGTREVASAITASTITTLVVFLPLLFIEGVTGVLLHQLAFVVSMSLVCSLVVSLTLTPVLTTFWEEVRETRPSLSSASMVHRLVVRFHGFNRSLYRSVELAYGFVLRFTLRFAGIIAFLLCLVFSLTLGLFPLIGTELMPKPDEGDIGIRTTMAAGVQLDMLDRQSTQVERTILESGSDVAVTAAFIGDDATDGDDWHRAWFRVKLVPRTERNRTVEEFRADLEERIGAIPGMKVKVQTRNDMMVFRLLNRRSRGDVEVEIRGHDIRAGEQLAKSVARTMEHVSGLTNVDVAKEDRRPVMSAVINRMKASLLGISVTDIAQAVETTIRGTKATVFHEDGEEFNVLVRLHEHDRKQQSDVGRVGVATPSGRIIPLNNLVRFVHSNDSLAINRLDQQRTIKVTGDITDRDLGSVVVDLRERLNQLSLPRGFSINIAGDWEEQQRSFRALTFGFIMAIVLMYMVMASQFESLRDPLIILITIPLGAIGVILMLLSNNTTLNVQSFIGIVMLSGIVVNNAIVLVDYTNRLRKRHPDADTRSLIIEATTRRFRPIVMTTVTTVLAMTPIALGWGEGGELQAPLAQVVIGGLLSGTLITLIAIPIVQQYLSPRNTLGEYVPRYNPHRLPVGA